MITTVRLRHPDQPGWLEFTHPFAVVTAWRADEVAAALADVEHRVATEQLYAAGFVSYEAAPGFDTSLSVHKPGKLPLLCFGLFASPKHSLELPDRPRAPVPGAASAPSWRCEQTQRQYEDNIRTIRAHIAAGDTYQVNYTTQFKADVVLSEADFYRMCEFAPYGAWLDGPNFTIISASPELFFTRRGQVVTCKPMKGTAARGLDSVSDAQQAQWLSQSAKNRAENLMITDMVRNDLGRIAVPGSVRVSGLFAVDQYPTVWQMTSTVQAETHASITDLFCALFPGASITGAPKRASMAFIRELESEPREIYTGAIGMLAPSGDAHFSIAIRTAWTDKQTSTSYYGAGGGIVWDSSAQDEFAELITKTQILTSSPVPFELLETLFWSAEIGVYLQSWHIQRLAASARYFDFQCDTEMVVDRLQQVLADLPNCGHRIRLCLARDGKVTIETSPCAHTPNTLDAANRKASQPLALAQTPVDPNDVLLYHKTTNRQIYEQASSEVEEGCEALLYNVHGFVTESVIANIVYQLGETLYTPPVADGLLPGTLRAELLAHGAVKERSLHIDELGEASQLYLVNALRGWRRAQLT